MILFVQLELLVLVAFRLVKKKVETNPVIHRMAASEYQQFLLAKNHFRDSADLSKLFCVLDHRVLSLMSSKILMETFS